MKKNKMIALLLISFSLALGMSAYATNNDVGYADQHRVTVSTGTNYQTVTVQAPDELVYRPQLQSTTQIGYIYVLNASEVTQTTVAILPKIRDVDCLVSLSVKYKNKNSGSELIEHIKTRPRENS